MRARDWVRDSDWVSGGLLVSVMDKVVVIVRVGVSSIIGLTASYFSSPKG